MFRDIQPPSQWVINTQFDTTGTTDWTDTITATTIELPDELIDWLPYKVEKYLPTWHLVKSYNIHKHELYTYDIVKGETVADWFCKHCKKWEWDW